MSEFEEENEMSNFEEEFNNCLHFGFIPNEPQNKIIEHFKYWQPPKPLVVVPHIIGDWIELIKQINRNVLALLDSDDMPCDVYDWLFIQEDDENIKLILLAWVKGYTVEKEKLYLLKHIEISNRDTTINCYLTHTFTAPFIGHTNFSKGYDMSDVKDCHFIQSEIDGMEIGSYEQIEVNP